MVRDAATDTGIKSTFLGNRMIAHNIVAVTDVTGNAIPEIATMGVVKTSNQIMAPVRDASLSTLHQTVFWANQFEPVATDTIADINLEWFVNTRRVGITAGASTPARVTREVIEFVEAYEPAVTAQ